MMSRGKGMTDEVTPDSSGVTDEVTPDELVIAELANWLRVRKLKVRLNFQPGKSSLPLERQLRKAMADFDGAQKRPPSG